MKGHAPNKVLVLATGGTIDKDYTKQVDGAGFEFGSEPAVTRILEQVTTKGSVQIKVQLHSSKDSTQMTDEDRYALAQAVVTAKQHKIVVTHGTDTMLKSAQVVEDALINSGNPMVKTVVFTGANKPQRFAQGDASFNVGAAFGCLSVAPPGVYVSMGGAARLASACVRGETTGASRQARQDRVRRPAHARAAPERRPRMRHRVTDRVTLPAHATGSRTRADGTTAWALNAAAQARLPPPPPPPPPSSYLVHFFTRTNNRMAHAVMLPGERQRSAHTELARSRNNTYISGGLPPYI